MNIAAQDAGRPRWLWITPEVRDDLSTGALVYSMQLARAVARTGIDVTLVGIGTPTDQNDGITTVTVDSELRGGLRSLLSRLPNLAYACSPAIVRDQVAELLGKVWGAVVIDGLQAAWATELVASHHRGPTVFVAHNHEASLRRNVARETAWTSPRRVVLSVDAWKAARLERAVVGSAQLVTSITETDRCRFERGNPTPSHIVVTPGWSGTSPDVGDQTPMAQRPRRVAILGSFDWHVKQENLRRFVAAADSVFAENQIELVVGGRIPDDVRTSLAAGTRATHFAGWVDDAHAFLDSSRIGVVSEPLGGGFKLKTLDYVFNRVPLATTAGGAAGLDLVSGQSMIEVASETELAAAIVDVIDDAGRLEALAAAAYARCAAAFTWDGRGQVLVEGVDRLSLL